MVKSLIPIQRSRVRFPVSVHFCSLPSQVKDPQTAHLRFNFQLIFILTHLELCYHSEDERGRGRKEKGFLVGWLVSFLTDAPSFVLFWCLCFNVTLMTTRLMLLCFLRSYLEATLKTGANIPGIEETSMLTQHITMNLFKICILFCWLFICGSEIRSVSCSFDIQASYFDRKSERKWGRLVWRVLKRRLYI